MNLNITAGSNNRPSVIVVFLRQYVSQLRPSTYETTVKLTTAAPQAINNNDPGGDKSICSSDYSFFTDESSMKAIRYSSWECYFCNRSIFKSFSINYMHL